VSDPNDPTDYPTPRPRDRVPPSIDEQVAAVRSRDTDPAPAVHETSEPVDVVAALANMMATHEVSERADLEARESRYDRKLSEHHDRLVVSFRKEAEKLTRPFLERYDAWRKGESSRIDALTVRVDNFERETMRQLADVRQQLDALIGDAK
jgi:hypothetical protein